MSWAPGRSSSSRRSTDAMKRRHVRRRTRPSPLAVTALLIALAVVVAAVTLIVHGDTTPH